MNLQRHIAIRQSGPNRLTRLKLCRMGQSPALRIAEPGITTLEHLTRVHRGQTQSGTLQTLNVLRQLLGPIETQTVTQTLQVVRTPRQLALHASLHAVRQSV